MILTIKTDAGERDVKILLRRGGRDYDVEYMYDADARETFDPTEVATVQTHEPGLKNLKAGDEIVFQLHEI